MNKKELTAKVAQQTGFTAIATLKVIDAVLDTIKDALLKEESTVLQGFGSFGIRSCAQRNGVNPSTKQPMTIPARRVVKFSPSRLIKIN